MGEIEPLIDVVDKSSRQYYIDEINILRDTVSIPAVLISFVRKKNRRLDPWGNLVNTRVKQVLSERVARSGTKEYTECTKN